MVRILLLVIDLLILVRVAVLGVSVNLIALQLLLTLKAIGVRVGGGSKGLLIKVIDLRRRHLLLVT